MWMASCTAVYSLNVTSLTLTPFAISVQVNQRQPTAIDRRSSRGKRPLARHLSKFNRMMWIQIDLRNNSPRWPVWSVLICQHTLLWLRPLLQRESNQRLRLHRRGRPLESHHELHRLRRGTTWKRTWKWDWLVRRLRKFPSSGSHCPVTPTSNANQWERTTGAAR